MSILATLIRGRQDADAVEVATATTATIATDVRVEKRSVATVATVTVADQPEPLADPRAEARRLRVLAMLADHPESHRAFLTDTDADPEAVILALAIRDAVPGGSTVTCEFRIPREKYDPWLLLELVSRHGGTLH